MPEIAIILYVAAGLGSTATGLWWVIALAWGMPWMIGGFLAATNPNADDGMVLLICVAWPVSIPIGITYSIGLLVNKLRSK